MGMSIQANSSIDLSKTSQLMCRGKGNGLSIFDKQITKWQELIQKIQADSGLDADSKKLKIQEIEDQIKEIEKQKQTKYFDDLKKSQQKPKNSTSQNYETESDSSIGVTYELTKAVVEGDNAVNNINKTDAILGDIKNEIRIVEGESNLTPSNESEQSRLQRALVRTTESLYEQIGEANDNVKKSNKKIVEANEAENSKETSAPDGNTTISTDYATQNKSSDAASLDEVKEIVNDGVPEKKQTLKKL